MAIPDHPIIWMAGADPRMTGTLSEWSLGRIRTNDLSPNGFFSSIANFLTPPSILTYIRPFVVSAAPFTMDQLGNSFPPGTVWVVCGSAGEGSQVTQMRSIGAGGTGNASIITSAWYGSLPVDIVYRAAAVPAGAHGTIVIQQNLVTVATFTVQGPTTGHANIFYALGSAFTGNTAGFGIVVTSTWTGGTPVGESISVCETGTNNVYIAVPYTLPTGYTARNDTDLLRGGGFANRYQAGPKRLGVKPNIPYSNYGIGGDVQMGLPHIQGTSTTTVWVGGQPQSYSWMPQAVGTQFYTSVAGGVIKAFGGVIIPFGGAAVSTPGFRNSQINMQVSGTPQVGDSFSVTIIQDGVTLFSNSYAFPPPSGPNQIVSQIIPLGPIMPATLGGTTLLSMITTGSSGGTSNTCQVSWAVLGSPRVDIPLPFSCAGANGFAYQGGYLPSALSGFITNTQPLQKVTGSSYVQTTTPNCLQFTPTTDSWYQVLITGGTAVAGAGEDPFGYTDLRTLARGHLNRPFYCLANTLSTTYTLTPYTPTVPSIAPGGTTLDMSFSSGHGGFAWGSIQVTKDGPYLITVSFVDAGAIPMGMVISYGTADRMVCDYASQFVWEPIDELGGTSFSSAQILSTPPGTPSTTVMTIVGPTPTGVFVGYTNYLALWDSIANQYQFIAPTSGTRNSVALPYLWNGSAWVTAGGTAFTLRVVIAAAQPLYLATEVFTTENNILSYAPGRASLSWAAAP